MSKKYLSPIWLFFIISCVPQEKFYIANINDLKTLEDNTTIYVLPKTILYITVKATKTTFIPGPFHNYAYKYLSISNVRDSSRIQWNIPDIDIGFYNEADPDYFFSVRKENIKTPNQTLSRLAEDSLILYPDQLFKKHSFYEQDTSSASKIYYTDLSVKQNIDLIFDTTYREVYRDSVYVKIPILNKQLASKSLEEKAEEAANFIVKIRKRRFKLLSGQYDYMPDGEALAVAVKELNKLEREYLSLFTGKEYTDTYKKTIQYIPDNSKKVSKEILFRFSGTEGFVDLTGVKGKPVIIEVYDLDKTISFEHLSNLNTGSFTQKSLWARLPDLAKVKILLNNKTITEAELPVYQFGSLIPFFVNN